MRRRLPWVFLGLVLVGTGGGLAYWRLRPPPEAPADQRSFEDIPKEEYEEWMQELGYTE